MVRLDTGNDGLTCATSTGWQGLTAVDRALTLSLLNVTAASSVKICSGTSWRRMPAVGASRTGQAVVGQPW